MKRSAVIDLINNNGPEGAEAILQKVAKEEWSNYMIVPARFKPPTKGEENDNDNHWQPMVIDKNRLNQHDSGGRLQCSRARIVSVPHTSVVGYAFQSRAGNWTWVG